MKNNKKTKRQDCTTPEVEGQEKETLEMQIRGKIREWIVEMVEEELSAVLSAGRHVRSEGRRGYRNGRRKRTFTSSVGHYELELPRGYIFGEDGKKKEWHTQLLPRYRRRSDEVEKAVLEAYLCGSSTRKIKRILSPLLSGAKLSRSVISRIVARLSESFKRWRERSLAEEDIVVLFLDALVLKLRLGAKVERIPLLVALGVRSNGEKVVLYLEGLGSESKLSWGAVLGGLKERGLREPMLAVTDGNKGVCRALEEFYPGTEHQRCTVHKRRNLLAYVPKSEQEELKADYHKIIYAEDRAEAEAEYQRFCEKWEKKEERVVKSLKEAGEELLTFFNYPEKCRRSLHSTNAIERLIEEFRRRLKVQGSLPGRDSAEKLCYGMIAGGIIRLNRISGHRELGEYVRQRRQNFNFKEQEQKNLANTA